MNIPKQGKTLRGILILLCVVFVSLLPQMLYAEEQIQIIEDQIIKGSEYCQASESSELSEKQLSDVQGQGFNLAVTLKEEGASVIILWDEKANIHTDVSVATGTMNHQSNILSVQGR